MITPRRGWSEDEPINRGGSGSSTPRSAGPHTPRSIPSTPRGDLSNHNGDGANEGSKGSAPATPRGEGSAPSTPRGPNSAIISNQSNDHVSVVCVYISQH